MIQTLNLPIYGVMALNRDIRFRLVVLHFRIILYPGQAMLNSL